MSNVRIPIVNASVAPQQSGLKVVWLHDTPQRLGVCENYICQTKKQLQSVGVSLIFLYGLNGMGSPDMLDEFEEAYPIVDLMRQLDDIAPDVIFAHRFENLQTLEVLNDVEYPTLMFFHDRNWRRFPVHADRKLQVRKIVI